MCGGDGCWLHYLMSVLLHFEVPDFGMGELLVVVGMIGVVKREEIRGEDRPSCSG